MKSALARLGEQVVNAIPFFEIESKLKNRFATCHDLIYALTDAIRAGYLRHPNPELRISGELIAERFLEKAGEVVTDEGVFQPALPLQFAASFFSGANEESMRQFNKRLFEGTETKQAFYLPTSIFRHLQKCHRANLFSAQQELQIVKWAKAEDERLMQFDKTAASARVERRVFSNYDAACMMFPRGDKLFNSLQPVELRKKLD